MLVSKRRSSDIYSKYLELTTWRPPRKQTYYRILATFTHFCAIGDRTWWGFDPLSGITSKIFFVQRLLVNILAPSVLMSQLAYLVIHYRELSFEVRGTMFAAAPVTTMVFAIVVFSKQKSFIKVMKAFISEIHLCNLEVQDNYIAQRLTQEEVSGKLIEIVKYHTFVLSIFRKIQDGFGLNVSAYYLYNLVADSLNLYQLMTGEKRKVIVYALMVIVYVGGLVMMSFVLEEVRRQSDGLADSVYHIDWEKMSVPNRKMVILLLMRIQPELVFTAAGGLKAGVRPMISIARTSFSIYVMLKQSMKA
ncbi:7tm odorant receptor domain-containing protein [Phthorimaea operculella]|nr:7tm odorant receptor domain-containing protein [Phthorimaea operculella]